MRSGFEFRYKYANGIQFRETETGEEEFDLEEKINKLEKYEVAPYELTLERLSLKERLRTTVRIQYKITVVDEADETPQQFEFVASQDDGLVAHAVYSGSVADLEYMDTQANLFLEKLFKDVAKANADPEARRKAIEEKEREDNFKAFQRNLDSGIGTAGIFDHIVHEQQVSVGTAQSSKSIPKDSKSIPKDLFTLKGAMKNILKKKFKSVLSDMRKETETEDIAAIEARVIFIRMMVYESIPKLYEFEAPQELILESKKLAQETIDQSLRESTDDAERKNIDATNDQPKDTPTAASEAPAAVPSMQQEPDEETNKEAEENAMEWLEEQFNLIKESDMPNETSVVYTLTTDTTLCRKLPQLVKCNAVMGFSFLIPKKLTPADLLDAPPSFNANGEIQVKGYRWIRPALLGLASTSAVVLLGAALAWNTYLTFAFHGYQATQYGGVTSILLGGSSGGGYLAMLLKGANAAKRKQIEGQLAILNVAKETKNNVSVIAYTLAEYSFQRIQNINAIRNALQDHSVKVRGDPVNDAFRAARRAVVEWNISEKKRLSDLGTLTDATVVYNTRSGKRVQFIEFFADYSVAKSNPIYKNDDWASATDTDALRIKLPPDIDHALYEAEEIRGIPLSKTMEFVTGTHAAIGFLDTSAKETFQELALVVVNTLKLMHNGQRLQQSPSTVCIQIVSHISSLLKAVYGSVAGVTLVSPSDTLWSCLRGGPATRLALQHISQFLSIPDIGDTTKGIEFLQNSFKVWNAARRAAIDQFSRALIEEAKVFIKSGPPQMYMNVTSGAGVEAKRTFTRVKSLLLTKPNTFTAREIQKLIATKLGIDDHDGEAYDFAYQEDMRPLYEQRTVNFNTVWASRRVDTTLARSIQIGVGATSVIEQMSTFDLHDRELVFYCPVGGNLVGLPERVPFVYEKINNKVVWLNALEEAVRELIQNLSLDETPKDAWILHAIAIQKRKVSGVLRHPATIGLKGKIVKVGLSQHEASWAVKADMHRRAYNTDRLFCAISLCSSCKDKQDSVHVLVPQQDVICMALALALSKVQIGDDNHNVIVHCKSREYLKKTREELEKVVTQVNQALILGCKVVPLGELCICI